MNPVLPSRIVGFARQEIGTSEVAGSNCGPRVDEYKAATWLDPHKGWPWCAAFVCWLVMMAMKGGTWTFERPETAGAWDFRNWSLKQDNSTRTKDKPGDDLRPGDIVAYTFSHIGIVSEAPRNGKFKAIEGNTDGNGSREGGAVWEKTRSTGQVKFRIRFTV